jgi:hypothetical protein
MKQGQARPWNAKRFHQKGKVYEFAFAGAKVASLRIGGPFQIFLGDDFATRIDLWMPFAMSQFGQSQNYDPSEPTALAPLLGLIGSTVVKASAGDAVPLTLEFNNGMTIEAPLELSSYQWEAWQITDEHGFSVVCRIGGDLEICLPDAEASRRWNRPEPPHAT